MDGALSAHLPATVAPRPRADYRAALDQLFLRTTGKWKLGLDRMRALLQAIDRPERTLRAFHVGGTNGKGSVCATLDALLRGRAGRVGVYSSPHLVDFRERIRIDGVPVTEAAVVDWIERRGPIVEALGATFFEATTAMAFEMFAQAAVDVAVIEVGLGGRLDATNVLDPLAAGVVSIGIDHVEYLGDTREQIAWEKAGIFKAGRPAIIGEPDPGVRALLARHARAADASPIVVAADSYRVSEVVVSGSAPRESDGTVADGDQARATGDGGTTFTLTTPRGAIRVRTPLAGVHQASNVAVAAAMMDAAGAPYTLPLQSLGPALARVRLPGRFDRFGRYIFDVAHNPDGAAMVAETLRAVRPPAPVVAVLSVLADKDWRGVMAQLAPVVSNFVITTAPTAPASRAWDPGAAVAYARTSGWSAELIPDLDAALARAADIGATVLVTGSFHTVGDAMACLQASPLAG